MSDLLPLENESGIYRIASSSADLSLVLPIMSYSLVESDKKKPVVIPELAGYLVAVFDRSYFATDVVAGLFDRYIGSSGSQYVFTVITGTDGEVLASSPEQSKSFGPLVEGADEKVRLTAWTGADNLLLSEVLAATDEDSAVFSPLDMTASFRDLYIRQWYSLASDRRILVPKESQFLIENAGKSLDQEVILYIIHSAGDIGRAVLQSRNRRLAISYAVLASFALVAVVYFLLYRRARELRDREHEFVATVTHELRTPIAGVNAVADNLSKGIASSPSKVKEYGEAILEHGRRLKNLIDQVLMYAELSSSAYGPELELIDVEALVRETASSAADEVKERLIVHVQDGLRRFRCDPIAIVTVVSNLISNAAKHAGGNATITSSVYLDERWSRRWLIIRVSDTGNGIPRRDLRSVIQPFYRGETSRVGQVPGSGLGLSLVNRVARAYQGQLSINSVLGSGTTVTVRLFFEQETADET